MGEVLEAVRTGPGGFRMPVALKRLVADEAIRGETVQRFFAEARILARLDHPNIVRVHDVLAVDAGYFIVMELLRGATLAGLALAAQDRGGMAWPDVLAVADQALAGLAYAHAACGDDGRPLGLVHRDVTPRNLFVTDAGQVKLLDFGIAKLHERLEAPITREGTVHGTLELLSPEQAAGESADASTDLYQLGAAMYWSLAGRYPHGSGSAPELLARIISRAPRPLTELRPDLPAEVTALIARAMARGRGDRFGSATAMREAVAQLRAPRAADPGGLARAVAELRAADSPADAAVTSAVGSTAEVTSTGGLTHTEAADGPGESGATPTALAATIPVGPRGEPRSARRVAVGAVAVVGAAAAVLWLGRDRGSTPARAQETREVMLTLAAGDQQPMGGGLSRDGARLVYATGSGVVVKPLTGGRAEHLAMPRGFQPIDAEFGPDGRIAAYGQNETGEWQVWQLGGRQPILLHGSPERFLGRLSPDGSAVAAARDQGEIVLVVPGQPPRQLADLTDGEMVSGMAWSPDGRQLAFVRTAPDGGDDRIDVVDVADARLRTIHRRPFATYTAVLLTWPDANRLLYAVNDRHGGTLYAFDLSAQSESMLHRWAGLTITGGRWSGGRLLYNRGTQRYGILVGERGGALHRVSTGDGQTRRLAGWTEQGWIFYANDAAGTLDLVAHPPGEQPALWMSTDADEMPDTLVDGAVIFQRSAAAAGDAAVGLWRSTAPGDARLLTSLPAAGMSANAVRCAGDRRRPCVLEWTSAGHIHYALFDPETGQRGREIAALPAHGYYLRHMAVSPDGATLAVVRGGRSIKLFDIATGAARELVVDGLSDLQSVSWSSDGRDLLVTCMGWRGSLFASLRVAPDGAVEPIETSQQRWYWRPQESLDGEQVAMIAVEFATDLAMLEGI
jgi:tRNA A-37 threonylcarbamoyl transferase component Bud32